MLRFKTTVSAPLAIVTAVDCVALVQGIEKTKKQLILRIIGDFGSDVASLPASPGSKGVPIQLREGPHILSGRVKYIISGRGK